MSRLTIFSVAIGLAFSLLATGVSRGEGHRQSTVPPALEIEVLDPGVDPLGNPAIQLHERGEGKVEVVIPPVILVHRYYYSGDRSFQGPLLPGGPSILVVNHPATGERCYIPAQMRPGAPRVSYNRSSIDYDYGDGGMTLCFGLCGKPTLKYRSGRTWTQKAGDLVHAEQIKEHCTCLKTHTQECASRTCAATKGLVVGVKEHAKVVTLPVQNVVRLMPFGAAITSGDLGPQLAGKAAQHKREHATRKAEKNQAWQQIDYRTNR